jgi:hypothetical protein
MKGVGSDSLVGTSPFSACKLDGLGALLRDGVNHIMKCNAFCDIANILDVFTNDNWGVNGCMTLIWRTVNNLNICACITHKWFISALSFISLPMALRVLIQHRIRVVKGTKVELSCLIGVSTPDS